MTMRIGSPDRPSGDARHESPTKSQILVGLLINPIAGIGGPAAMKGSDATWRDAIAQGIEPQAAVRARRFVAGCHDVAWLAAAGDMGLDGMERIDAGGTLGETTPEDTRRAAKTLAEAGVDLLCFVGGDGTAADVAAAVGESVPCLGVPGGVKITSPVFAHDPDDAAWLVSSLGPGFETVARDVTDLDEAAYRAGRVDVVLKGSLRVPMSPAVQGGKVATTGDTPLEPIVEQALRDWDPEATHLIGAGSVCMALKKNFWGEPTLLGVDAVKGGRIVQADLDAAAVRAIDGPVRVWLSLIGGQGMLLGRGTQVLPADVLGRIGWERIHVIAPPEKLMGLRGIHVDSGDPVFDAASPAYLRVLSGFNETRMVKVLRAPKA